MLEYDGAEEADRDITKRFVSREQVRSIEVAEDPVEVLYLLVPRAPSLQSGPQHIDVCPTQALLHLSLQRSTYVLLALLDKPLLDVAGHVLPAEVLDAAVQLLQTEVNLALLEDGVQRGVDLLPRLVEKGLWINFAYRPEVLDHQSLGSSVDAHVRCGLAHYAVAGLRWAVVGARSDVYDLFAIRHARPFAGEAIHVGGTHGAW